METTDGTTGYRDEQRRENRRRLGHHSQSPVAQTIPQLGNRGPHQQQSDHQSQSHKQQRDGKQRIDATDNLVDRHQRGNHIINEDKKDPGEGAATKEGENLGRTVDKHNTHHHQHEHGEYQHELVRTFAEIAANEFGQPHATMTQREHTAEIIVDSSGKNAAKHNPQITGWSELGSHNGTEDRSRSRDIEKLNHKDLPVGKDHEIYTVGLGHRRRGTVVRSKDTLNETAVEKIAQHKGQHAQ